MKQKRVKEQSYNYEHVSESSENIIRCRLMQVNSGTPTLEVHDQLCAFGLHAQKIHFHQP